MASEEKNPLRAQVFRYFRYESRNNNNNHFWSMSSNETL